MRIIKLGEKNSGDIINLDTLAYGPNYDIPPITKEKILEILNNGFILGIREKGKLLANIHVIEKEKKEWFIYTICTLPEKQGLGLATKLVKKVLELAKEKKIKKITVTIKPDNTKSIDLFTKFGFVKTKFLSDFHGKGKHRILIEYRV